MKLKRRIKKMTTKYQDLEKAFATADRSPRLCYDNSNLALKEFQTRYYTKGEFDYVKFWQDKREGKC
jgi:hypothetical protein